MASTSQLCVQLLLGLAEPAVRALALAGVAGLALAAGRVRDTAIRMAVWTAVLYAALAMPFLARLAPAVRLPIPALAAAQPVAAANPAVNFTHVRHPAIRVVDAATAEGPVRPAMAATSPAVFSWPVAAMIVYLLVAAALLGQLLMGFVYSRRVRRKSLPIHDANALAFLHEQCERASVATPPELAESVAVAVPVTLGMRRPILLLPSAWRDWEEEKITAVLAHELAHVVRRDALTRALATLHRGLFWFSPLSWWLAQHLAVLAEHASDDAALGTGADRTLYANVLLGFYQNLQDATGRVHWEGVAMTSGKQARKRVERILDSQRRLSGGLRRPAWGVLALLAAPAVYLLAGAQPVAANKLRSNTSRALAAPAVVSVSASLGAEMQAPPPPAQAPAAPAAAPKAPAPPPAANVAWGGDTGEEVMVSYGQSLRGSGMYHDYDIKHIHELRRQSNGDIIWFRRNGKSYIIHDIKTVQEAKDIWAPAEALGKQQEELGRQQEALGARQEELGQQMEQVRVAVPDMAAELQRLQARLAQLHQQGATQEELGDVQGALGDLQSKLGDLQSRAGDQQSALGSKQSELGDKQSKLGDMQSKLGDQQDRMEREAAHKMKALIDNALAKGLAQPE